MLANASLDVALHDSTHNIFLDVIIAGAVLRPPKTITAQELGPFTVGLIDGDGSLEVNHWRRKSLQFRLVVKLSDKPLNYEILCQIARTYGGYVRRKVDSHTSYVQ